MMIFLLSTAKYCEFHCKDFSLFFFILVSMTHTHFPHSRSLSLSLRTILLFFLASLSTLLISLGCLSFSSLFFGSV